MTKAEYEEGGSNACRKKFKTNQFGRTVGGSSSAAGTPAPSIGVGVSASTSGAESKPVPPKASVSAAKTQADRDSRAARRQSRGTKK